ncbi:hypothetical protein L484_007685 [Morus notabilis]|uniref:Non-haem dioxygenase N-terminal domain-containing protein n=1 Tax=Morus notabilis TaxID=981085 RepID=W9S4F3_9ROSA|nr:gibberellin 2-beta-dioxygenase 2 [Morus notabilis]EXB88402.1 hypothetical protein L484_007685 [Morus notabilis]
MASSAQNIHSGATSAPPPTPSTQPNNNLFSTTSSAAAADALSRLLHRLPPALSLPSRRLASPPAKCPPSISLSGDTILDDLLSSSSQLGFFQFTGHSVPPQLASSAESEALAILNLAREQKESCFPKNWPLGYEAEEDEEGDGQGEFLCLDSACSAESTELAVSSVSELTRELERVGLRIVEMLSGSVGFENPFGNNPERLCSYMWISEDLPGKKAMNSGGFYPYVVGLQYQIRSRKYSLMADSGWVSVLPQIDSVMVTIGDIAQVWSNGKLKKVRGRPIACSGEGMNNTRSISMTVLITLPLDSTVSPLLPKDCTKTNNTNCGHNHNKDEECEEEEEKRLFNSFSFEDYAWRVYHERFPIKDPLDRYRIK